MSNFLNLAMVVVFDDNYVRVEVDSSRHLCVAFWKPMYKSDEQWKEIKLRLIDIIKKYEVENFLACTRNSVFPTPPSLQEWLTEKVKEEDLGSKLKKAGVVLPDDLIVELSLQQIGESLLREAHIPVRYFKDKRRAFSWLGVE